jgi:hypothetical protein
VGKCLTTLKAKDLDSNASLVYDFILTKMKAYLSGRVQVDKNKYDYTVSAHVCDSLLCQAWVIV